MTEMLSQEEINALLGGGGDDDGGSSTATAESLTTEEKDALGEIGNISMGTAATTLFTLLNHKVLITTPNVELLTWDEFVDSITDDLTVVSVGYTEGFSGTNLMILKDEDVKVIADLMMGGTGTYLEGPVNDFHLSAIAESMNQMIGSSSTSMSQVFNKKIDISPPHAYKQEDNFEQLFGGKSDLVKISFRLQIEEGIIDSELMQILPIKFAKELISDLLNGKNEPEPEPQTPPSTPTPEPVPTTTPTPPPTPTPSAPTPAPTAPIPTPIRQDIDVKAPQFENFDSGPKVYPKENMDILMDVSLEVSVELGRTTKKIKEILEFGPGSIIELNRLVGEPVDVLVNGKFVASGEVVVIDENFGVRITDIINPENRI